MVQELLGRGYSGTLVVADSPLTRLDPCPYSYLLPNCISLSQGRLSQEEIDRMVKEAELYREEDKVVKDRIDARNSLEASPYIGSTGQSKY